MNRKPFLVVAGNIGAGKSTLVERISRELGLQPAWEASADNPYLERFYADMAGWAFHSQLYFLTAGLREHLRILSGGGGVIQDRSVYEHFLVFAHELRDQGLIASDDFTVLSDLYFSVQDLLQPPDLLIYLEAPLPVLQARIRERGRGSEQAIEPAYLARLQNRYNGFLDSWYHSPTLRVNTASHDIRSEEGLARIAELVAERLEGVPTPAA